MRHFKLWLAAIALAILPGLHPAILHAQDKTASVHGHVQDPVGVSIANADVRFSTDGKDTKYTFTTDSNGDYKGDGIAPGTYVLLLTQKDPKTGTPKTIDFFKDVKFAAGESVTQDFDLSRAEYIKALPPDQQKAIADAKQKNAGIVKENQDVKKLNGMLADARADITAKKYDDAAALMTQGTQIKADSAVLWLELGIAQDGQKKYPDAITSLKKAIELDAASKKPLPEIEGGEPITHSAKRMPSPLLRTPRRRPMPTRLQRRSSRRTRVCTTRTRPLFWPSPVLRQKLSSQLQTRPSLSIQRSRFPIT